MDRLIVVLALPYLASSGRVVGERDHVRAIRIYSASHTAYHQDEMRAIGKVELGIVAFHCGRGMRCVAAHNNDEFHMDPRAALDLNHGCVFHKVS